MKQAIIITSTPQSGRWLENCIKSFQGYDKYKIVVVCDYTYELGKMRWVMQNTKLDEFFILHDTCEIKNPKLFDVVFEKHKGRSVAISDDPVMFGMYLGKYRRKILEQMRIPQPKSKLEVVRQEIAFNKRYIALDPRSILLCKDFRDNDVFEKKYDRINMKLENKYLIKWKGTWNLEMIQNA